ncbi:MAG: hypothetical protein NVSMB43_20180 [Pseudarthrobacter sp.]
MDKTHAKNWSREYLEQVDLADKVHTRVDKLSGGQQQKIQLGVTIMNDPQLLILDEPTKGFDPVVAGAGGSLAFTGTAHPVIRTFWRLCTFRRTRRKIGP